MELLSKSIKLSTKLAWYLNRQNYELRALREDLIKYQELLDQELTKQRDNK